MMSNRNNILFCAQLIKFLEESDDVKHVVGVFSHLPSIVIIISIDFVEKGRWNLIVYTLRISFYGKLVVSSKQHGYWNFDAREWKLRGNSWAVCFSICVFASVIELFELTITVVLSIVNDWLEWGALAFSRTFNFTGFFVIIGCQFASEILVQGIAEPSKVTTEVIGGVVLFILAELKQVEILTYVVDVPPIFANFFKEAALGMP